MKLILEEYLRRISGIKIMIFTEGTVTVHKTSVGLSREEIVKQVKEGDPSVHNISSYIPVKNAVVKLKIWEKQGAKILYLTSRRRFDEVKNVKDTLKKYNFPKGKLYFRKGNQEYKNVAEYVVPDILIEDDCESIGGIDEMTITHVNPQIKKKIKSIVIKEFGGIDFLPDKLSKLLSKRK